MGSLFSNPGFDPARDIPNLTGKRVVVTGANSGIGYHTVKHLLRRGATVWMACRNERKAEDAMKRLDQYFANLGLRLGHGGVGDVKYLNCDLSSPARAKAAAAELMTKERRLDILINNAGILRQPFSLNEEGLSSVMATNHLGPFAFTVALLPLLSKTSLEQNSDVRIVNVASEAHRYFAPSKVQFKSIEDFNIKIGDGGVNDFARYCQVFMSWRSHYPNVDIQRLALSKLSTILFTAELQRILDRQNIPILTTCLHPGLVMTEGADDLIKSFGTILAAIWLTIATLFWLSPDQGSFTTLFAATSPEIKSHPGPFRGRYMVPYGKPVDSTPLGEDKQLALDLWLLSERLANQTSKM